ncbi:MAG: DNA methyltransferase [Nitrososphaerota archaeon]|nr:DNA methyltransferase [Nitrososphaerota archaeon]
MREHHLYLLSGECPELAFAELRSLAKVLTLENEPELITSRLAKLECPRDKSLEMLRRSAFLKELSVYHGTLNRIEGELPLQVADGERVAVRVKKLGNLSVPSIELERRVGANIKRANPNVKIDLERPTRTIRVYVDPSVVVLATLLVERGSREFEWRSPAKRPFRHPSLLQPKLARCMVNLTETPIGGVILDPFAGTGSIPIEATILGYEAIGIEIRRWIARGGYRNLVSLKPGDGHMVVGDARRLPLHRQVDGVATDPPYGKSTYVSGRDLRALINDFLSEISSYLRRGAKMVISYPSTGPIREVIEGSGLEVSGSYSYFVHSSLIRRIAVTVIR